MKAKIVGNNCKHLIVDVIKVDVWYRTTLFSTCTFENAIAYFPYGERPDKKDLDLSTSYITLWKNSLPRIGMITSYVH